MSYATPTPARKTIMARPKKPRYVDGVQLPDNLYPDPKKRANKWRYVRPDGTSRIFQATVQEAVKAAEEANKLRDTPITISPKMAARDAILTHVERYITWREGYDPKLAKKRSWTGRCNMMRSFAEHFSQTKIHHLTLGNMRTWWEDMSYYAQHHRRSEFNRLFNYFAGHGLTPRLESNPFTTADDRPRLMEKSKPTVKRVRLKIDPFWVIYRLAAEMGYYGLQIAMGISLVTTMRRGDIAELRFDQHVTDTSLRKTINKSAAQRDDVYVAHLEWRFSQHVLLHALIKRARELSLQNFRCPYVISHRPKQKRTGKTKDHVCQLTSDQLGKQFSEVRDATGLFPPESDTYSPPGFHEVRATASNRYDLAGYDIKQVQALMAHTDERVTRGYQAGHGINYEPVEITLTAESIGGEF